MCVPPSAELQSGSQSSRWFGKGATSSIVTGVDIPDKVLEKRIHLAEVQSEEREGNKAFLLQGFWASRARQGARARAARR
jgi:hypothetical protein